MNWDKFEGVWVFGGAIIFTILALVSSSWFRGLFVYWIAVAFTTALGILGGIVPMVLLIAVPILKKSSIISQKTQYILVSTAILLVNFWLLEPGAPDSSREANAPIAALIVLFGYPLVTLLFTKAFNAGVALLGGYCLITGTYGLFVLVPAARSAGYEKWVELLAQNFVVLAWGFAALRALASRTEIPDWPDT